MSRRNAAALACLIIAGCAPGTDDPVLATYPGGEITRSEFDAEPTPRRRQPPPAETVIRRLALTETLAAAAESRNAGEDPALAQALRREDDRPWVAALQKQTRVETEPDEAAILEYLEEHRDQLEKPRKVRLSNLFKRAPIDGSPDTRRSVRERMARLHRELVDGADFAQLARAESEAVNAYRGGKMGAVPPGQLKREVEETAFALDEGEFTGVIPIAEGFVIIKHGGVVEARTLSEDEAIERIRTAMRRWNFDDAWDELKQELFAASDVHFDGQAVATAEATTPVASIAGTPVTYGFLDAMARSRSTGSVSRSTRLTGFRIQAVFEAMTFNQLAAERARQERLDPEAEAIARSRRERQRLLANHELELRAAKRMRAVSDIEIREFFDANPKYFDLPDRAHIGVIQLRLDGDPSTLQVKTQLGRSTIERIRAGQITFAEAAREVSEHPSADKGGDLGLKPRRWAAGLGPNVLNAFDQLEPGQITELTRQDHLWILELKGLEPGRARTFEEAADDARWGAEQEYKQVAISQVERELLAEIEEGLVLLQLPQAEAPTDSAVPGTSQDPSVD